MPRLLSTPMLESLRREFEIHDHFTWYVKTHQWTDVQADATSTVTQVAPSNIRLFTSVDNEEALLATVTEMFQLIAWTKISCEASIQLTEVQTNTTGAWFGMADGIGANQIVDSTGVPAINDTGFCIHKGTGGTKWQFSTNVGGGTIVTSTSSTVAGNANYQTLRIEANPINATDFQLRPFVDGAQLIDSTSNLPIQHTIVLGTSVTMDFGIYIKGGHADDMVLLCDYLYGSQGLASALTNV